VFDAGDIMAQITAERLVQHLEASGFMIVKKPAAPPPMTSHMPPSVGRLMDVIGDQLIDRATAEGLQATPAATVCWSFGSLCWTSPAPGNLPPAW
jgi:hypothetical protein